MDYRVIKENDFFLISGLDGDIHLDQEYAHGFYTQDTRFINRLELLINGHRPVLLHSIADDNYFSTFLLTNPHIENKGVVQLWRESLQIERTRFIYNGVLYEQVQLTNFSHEPIQFKLSIFVDADFQDMFAIRGFQNGHTGKMLDTTVTDQAMILSYIGLDDIKRNTKITWNEPAVVSTEGTIDFSIHLNPAEMKAVSIRYAPFFGDHIVDSLPADQAIYQLKQSYEQWNEHATQVDSDDLLFNRVYHRGKQDLRGLLTDKGFGLFPVAGVPWYAVPFGRDSLITALQMLPLNPMIAKHTLFTLANYQGENLDPWRDEQPGKIMHEIRYGELANTNQIPFTPYYGTIDATPLFLVLAAEYFHWTNDLDTIRDLLPHIEQAMEWINKFGDRDHDLFVEYFQESSKGIANQGWKDSGNSIVHKSGELANAPIALVEVQGYVYQAKSKLAPILRLIGMDEYANQLEKEASMLKERFQEHFWMPEENYYAIALDSEERQVKSVTSNPGHLLMTEILDDEHSRQVAHRLVQDDLFSGFGIRTMSTKSTGYNPMSYHNGSVWPHDNSMILLGLGRLGFQQEACRIIDGLLQAASYFEYHRLPELICGYDAQVGYPIPYPVACSPQAWAAGTSIVLLQTILGITPDACKKQINLKPGMPSTMNELHVRNLRIGDGALELKVKRQVHGFHVEVIQNSTNYEIHIQ